MLEPAIWRIVAGHPLPKSEVQAKSLHLGDWLRKSYVSVGFRDQQNRSMRAFREEMKVGDKVVVTTDGYVWALGEITGEMQTKEEPRLYSFRRKVTWYRVTRKDVKSFPRRLRNKLSNPQTVMPLDESDWGAMLACC